MSLSKNINLAVGSISAKVCNYKSVAGINQDSDASINTIEIYNKYGQLSLEEIENVLNKIQRPLKLKMPNVGLR
jgi:DNA-directed RNA polymerase alpha subunit